MEILILFGVFTVLMLIGTPIAFCLGVSSFATVLYMGLPPLIVFQRLNSGMSIFSLLAIPFFIYSGDLMVRGGIAKNDTMLRVDVFTKAGKFHLVPVYVHHRVTGLPNRAIVAFKDEEEWTLINESFDWCFSLYPNDLVQVKLKGECYQGYYAGSDRATGAIGLWAHDRSANVGKDGLMRIGVTTACSIEKLHVDVLGHIYPALPAKRRGLA